VSAEFIIEGQPESARSVLGNILCSKVFNHEFDSAIKERVVSSYNVGLL